MLQNEYSAILLQNKNVLAFSKSFHIDDNQNCHFGCLIYEHERKELIKLEIEKTKVGSSGNSLKDKMKKAASCFLVT